MKSLAEITTGWEGWICALTSRCTNDLYYEIRTSCTAIGHDNMGQSKGYSHKRNRLTYTNENKG